MTSKGKSDASSGKDKAAARVAQDEFYLYDEDSQMEIKMARKWKDKPKYFKKCKISDVALIKMVMHAVSGQPLEIMGLMQGKIQDDAFIVMDTFALPGTGTETRVMVLSEHAEYMVSYMEQGEKVGKGEACLGWYHSHPGYDCWLSGIDVNTQKIAQDFSDPWVAVVVDPVKTIREGKVAVGAFRVFPEGYKDPDRSWDKGAGLPLDKVEDFGVHAERYYPLEVEYFKSRLDSNLLDLLSNQFWINILSSSNLEANRPFVTKSIEDMAAKMDKAETQIVHNRGGGGFFGASKKKEESELSKISKDATRVSLEQVQGLMGQVIKDTLFNGTFADPEASMDTTTAS